MREVICLEGRTELRIGIVGGAETNIGDGAGEVNRAEVMIGAGRGAEGKTEVLTGGGAWKVGLTEAETGSEVLVEGGAEGNLRSCGM